MAAEIPHVVLPDEPVSQTSPTSPSDMPLRSVREVSACLAEGQVSPNGTFYKLRGPEDGLLCVCIHGIGSTSHHFQLLAPVLVAAGFRVLAYDLIGRGYSPAPQDCRYDWQAHAAQLELLLIDIQLDNAPHIVIAHSMYAISMQHLTL